MKIVVIYSVEWFCTTDVNGSLNQHEPLSSLDRNYIKTKFWTVTSKQHKRLEQYMHIVKYLCWKIIIYNIDSKADVKYNHFEIVLNHCGWWVQEAEQREERWRLHHWAGQMSVCEGSWTPEVFFCKTQYLRGGEEEDGRGWSAYQFSRKAT